MPLISLDKAQELDAALDLARWRATEAIERLGAKAARETTNDEGAAMGSLIMALTAAIGVGEMMTAIRSVLLGELNDALTRKGRAEL